jgi:hypothetical protein
VGGGPATPVPVEQRWVPQRQEALALGGPVPGHLLDRDPGEGRGQGGGLADGRRGEPEGGGRAVPVGQPPQTPQDMGDVASEHPPQDVGLVDHHIAQPGEEPRPPFVVGQDPHVEHLGVGDQHPGLTTGQGPLIGGGVAVVHGHVQVRDQAGPGPELVPGEGLGGDQDQRGGPAVLVGGGRDRQLVAQRLARGRGGGHHQGPAGACQVEGPGLVGPQAALGDQCRHRIRQGRRGPPHGRPWGAGHHPRQLAAVAESLEKVHHLLAGGRPGRHRRWDAGVPPSELGGGHRYTLR